MIELLAVGGADSFVRSDCGPVCPDGGTSQIRDAELCSSHCETIDYADGVGINKCLCEGDLCNDATQKKARIWQIAVMVFILCHFAFL